MRFFSSTRQIFKSSRIIYNNFLVRKPYLAQSIQVSVLMGAGDVLAQTFVEKKSIKEINVYRTFQFAGIGFCFIGPCLRLWYGQLEKICKHQRHRWKMAITKVSLDQLVFAPIFLTAITTIVSLLQGMELQNVIKRLKNDYWELLRANYCIWPLAQLINFSVVPLNYQVLFVQVIAIVWNTYLSVKLH